MPSAVAASDLAGPGRFCGYSPVIDLVAGERVVTLSGGVHSGRFVWEGRFGRLLVSGIGWASRPRGNVASKRTSKGHVRFHQRRTSEAYVVAIWNERQGAAYFSSSQPLTGSQLAAIDRVDLYQEGEEPEGCNLRTTFSWD